MNQSSDFTCSLLLANPLSSTGERVYTTGIFSPAGGIYAGMSPIRESSPSTAESTPLSRRTVLRSAGPVASSLLAGCPGSPGERTTLQLREPDLQSLEIAKNGSTLRDDQITLLTDAAANGSATAYGYHPFRGIEYVNHDGTYYQLQIEPADADVVSTPVLVVTPVETTSEAVSLTEYDTDVVELLDPLLENSTRTRVLHPDMAGVDALQPEPRHSPVTWENDTYRLTVERRQVEQQARRIQAIRVATSTSEFKAYLRDQGVGDPIRPTDLSQEAKDILQQAIEETYEEPSPYSEGFTEALTHVRRGRELDAGEWGGRYLLDYSDKLYYGEISVVSSG